MTDYFALLDEARRPWLEPEKLKEKYFSLARTAPADAELNEAFRVLCDPKLRLHHLLTLEGADLIAGRPVPAAVADLSWKTGTLLREIEHWLVRSQAAASTLARALLRQEREELEQQLGKLEERLRATYEAELAQLPRGQVDWPNELTEMIGRYDTIAYLTRLLEQTSEKRFQLTAG